jgi:uncharacterized protein (DUF1330 family)
MDERELLKQILDELHAKVPDGQPVVMINLLRYRATAVYPAGSGMKQVTGREAYEHYTRLTIPHLIKVGARPIWRAAAQACFFAPEGESWDDAVLVRYPSRSAFERMITNPDYQAGTMHRTAALEDSRLIPTTSPQQIGRVAWWVIKLVSTFRRGAKGS